MTDRSWMFMLLVACLCPRLAWAQAGPPYQTDDPDPVPYQHWELYVSWLAEKTSTDFSGALPLVEVNYGAVPRVQLHVLLPLAFDRPTGEPTMSGLGDVEVGAKVQFVKEGRRRPMIGTFVMTEWPTGSAAKGLGAGHFHALLPLWLQKDIGSWNVDGGVGYWINPGTGLQNYWIAGAEVGRRLGSATIGAELFHATADEVGGRGSLLVNVGAVVDLTDEHHVLFSIGHTVDGARTIPAYVGYQLTFGPM